LQILKKKIFKKNYPARKELINAQQNRISVALIKS